MTIGELIRDSRKKLDMSQADVARAVGVDRATVNRWENGSINIDRKRVESICNVLHLDPAIFCHPNEVVFREERIMLAYWREADPLTQAMVRRSLGMEEPKNEVLK